MSSPSDSDLVGAARAGDRAAFGAIVGRYARAVSAVAYATTGDRVLGGSGYLASVARATPEPRATASTASSDTLPAATGSAAPDAPDPRAARAARAAVPPPAPALPPGSDDHVAAGSDDAADGDTDDPSLGCDALGAHWASLEAAFEPADAYHALRSPAWIDQRAHQLAERCQSWTPEARRCVAGAGSIYDLIWGCPALAPDPPGTRLALGRHVAAESGADLSCTHVAAHMASLYELDPDRLATVPPAYRAAARDAYAQMRADVPATTYRECEAEPWSETKRRCMLLVRADYLLGCAP